MYGRMDEIHKGVPPKYLLDKLTYFVYYFYSLAVTSNMIFSRGVWS